MKKHLIIIWVFILVLYPGLYIQGNTAKAESARIFEGMNEISNISALIQSYSESFQMPEGIQEKMMGSWEPIVHAAKVRMIPPIGTNTFSDRLRTLLKIPLFHA